MMRFYSIFIVVCLSLSLVQHSIAQSCGARRTSRIVGGVNTNVNEFPCMVGLIQAQVASVFCGGVILSNWYVLTSAHCMDGRSASSVSVLAGDHDYSTGADTPYAQLYPVQSCYVNNGYNYQSQINDIAILTLRNSLVYNAAVGPVCLPPTNLLFTNYDVEGVGWGSKSFGGPVSTILQKVQLKVISNDQCRINYANLQPTQLCTFTQYRDTCQKDSGGPIFAMINGRVNIVGVISYGQGCASNWPSVNTRVTSFVQWIKYYTPGAVYY